MLLRMEIFFDALLQNSATVFLSKIEAGKPQSAAFQQWQGRRMSGRWLGTIWQISFKEEM